MAPIPGWIDREDRSYHDNDVDWGGLICALPGIFLFLAGLFLKLVW